MKIRLDEVLGKRTIVLGEAGKGKTKLLAHILTELIEKGYERDITVIDLAPDRIGEIGGKLDEYMNVRRITYLKPEKIYAPRLQAKNREEAIRYAEHNLHESRKLLKQYQQNPTKILAINDITIHLHRGEVNEIIEAINKAETFIATAYKGKTLQENHGTGITKREEQQLNQLMKHMHKIIQL